MDFIINVLNSGHSKLDVFHLPAQLVSQVNIGTKRLNWSNNSNDATIDDIIR